MAKFHQFTASHQGPAINFLIIASNWYVGRKEQQEKQLHWDEFLRYIKIFMNWEKFALASVLKQILDHSAV